jgi:predicted nucleotide-binding protein
LAESPRTSTDKKLAILQTIASWGEQVELDATAPNLLYVFATNETTLMTLTVRVLDDQIVEATVLYIVVPFDSRTLAISHSIRDEWLHTIFSRQDGRLFALKQLQEASTEWVIITDVFRWLDDNDSINAQQWQWLLQDFSSAYTNLRQDAERLAKIISKYKPTTYRLFLGSSSEKKQVVESLVAEFQKVSTTSGIEYVVTPWYEAFIAGEITISSLLKQTQQNDISLFIFSADDEIKSRGTDGFTPRDNVILEAGLFMGVMGTERTFIIHSNQDFPKLKILSDLSGLNRIVYTQPKTDDAKEWQSAYKKVVNEVSKAVKKLVDRQLGHKDALYEWLENLMTEHPSVLSIQELELLLANNLIDEAVLSTLSAKLEDSRSQ